MFLLLVLLLVIVLAICLDKNLRTVIRKYFGGRQKLTIYTEEPWFSQIKSGAKKVEGRVGPLSSYEQYIGKRVKVKARKNEKTGESEKLGVTIKAARHYATLEEYVDKEKWDKVAPHLRSKKETIDAYLGIKNKKGEAIYGPERVKEKGGVTALEFVLGGDKVE